MDRNPSPPPSDSEEEAVAAGDSIGNTVYSKHWLFSVLTKLIELISPKKDGSELNNAVEELELDDDMENDICKVWDMSMDKDIALFLQEFKAPDIFMGVFAKSKCPRLTEICVGILGNMACFQDICVALSKDENLGQIVLQRLCDSDSPTLLETSRLLLTCLCQPEVANIWVERIRRSPSVYDCLCFIMSSSTNAQITVQKDLTSTCISCSFSPLWTKAFKQLSPEKGKETWSLLYSLLCNELCQPDDPAIIVQEQKTVLASILSVLSAIFTSRTEQEYVKIEKNMPLLDSLIRVLQNMGECAKRSEDRSSTSKFEEKEKLETAEEDFHLKILKDVSCELLSNLLQELSKENILEGLKQGHLNEQKCSCAFQNLLPLYFSSVESFFEVLHEADQVLADSLGGSFPSLKCQP